jgi:hypothetical protein
MTYREAIQLQIKALQEIYDNAGSLRDAAVSYEKEVFNNVRRRLPEVWSFLQELDNSLGAGQAAKELRGNYELHISSDV